jgi:UPF0716 protein FxsA
MRRFLIILLLLGVVPIVELTVLISIGQVIGAGWTILLVLATSALGAWLLRREGARSWRALREDASAGRPPGNAATDGVLVLAGGLLMLIPGFVSDVIGALLIAPPTRRLIRRPAQALISRRMSPAAAMSFFGPRTVRVRTGEPYPDRPASAGRESTTATETIEGEILDR